MADHASLIRPTPSLSSATSHRPCTGSAHQHGPLAVAQAAGLEERLDGLLVVDDREGPGPVGAPQAAVETPGIEHARERVPDVGNGYGSRDSVQAPLTLITQFGRLASSSTFGRSAQGSGGAGGTRGCRMPRWSMMNRVSGWRSISAVPASRLSQHRMLSGKSSEPPRAQSGRGRDRQARASPPSSAWCGCRPRPASFSIRDDVGHTGIVGVERLDDGEPAGMGPLHFHGIAGVIAVQRKGRDEDRAVDADLVHRRHHLVTRDMIGPVRHVCQGRFGLFAS